MTMGNIRYASNTPPVLLLTFCRPNQTARVLERIKKARPPVLYVACDGPRPSRDDDLCNIKAIQDLISRIDWCDKVVTLFRAENLGCGPAVSQAITWFMDQAGEGIILEDDCLPDPTFFRFCGEMLDRYRYTTNVMQVAGYNLLSGQYDSGEDYHFSHFGWQWGWATWKRAWDHFDLSMASWPEFKNRGLHRGHPFYPRRISVFNDTYAGKINTWDYQWHYACASNSGLSVVPSFSKIENIGFGHDATHGINVIGQGRFDVPVKSITFPLKHSQFINADVTYDQMLLKAAHRRSLRSIIRGYLSMIRCNCFRWSS